MKTFLLISWQIIFCLILLMKDIVESLWKPYKVDLPVPHSCCLQETELLATVLIIIPALMQFRFQNWILLWKILKGPFNPSRILKFIKFTITNRLFWIQVHVQRRLKFRAVSFLVNFLIRNANKQSCMLSNNLFVTPFLTRILPSSHRGNRSLHLSLYFCFYLLYFTLVFHVYYNLLDWLTDSIIY